VSGRPAALIGLDWGTTSARAYRLDDHGAVLGARSAPLGIQQVRDGYPQALAALLGDWSRDPAPRLACGMIGSRQGWIEAPYVHCPAPVAALARGIVLTQDGAIGIVPGLLCRDADRTPDVMRGEETQVAGVVADDAPPTLAILPGTHSKWAVVRDGTIIAFATQMTGEVFAVLREHSILGRMIDPATTEFTAATFARGVRRGLERGGELLHLLFGVRTLGLLDGLGADEAADYLSGVLIGSEIAAGRAWAAFHRAPFDSPMLIGGQALCDRYSTALREAGVQARIAPEDAAARGLWRIAMSAGIVR
jgi:2-dehydro-3-deoxygalactonokinase